MTSNAREEPIRWVDGTGVIVSRCDRFEIHTRLSRYRALRGVLLCYAPFGLARLDDLLLSDELEYRAAFLTVETAKRWAEHMNRRDYVNRARG